MRTKKLLSMILTLCLVFTTIGSITVVNAENVAITETYNLAQGTTYELPAGGSVNISNPGYQIVQDTDGKYYRVNVGTYGVIMYDDMEGNSTSYNPDGVTGTNRTSGIVGASLSIKNYDVSDSLTGTNKQGEHFETIDGNKVLVLGPTSSMIPTYTLTQSATPVFRVSMDIKLDSYDMSTCTTTGSQLPFVIQLNSTDLIRLRFYVNANKNGINNGTLYLRPYGLSSTGTATGGGDCPINVEYNVNGSILSTPDWFNLEFVANADGYYEIYINGTSVTKGSTSYTWANTTALTKIGVGKRVAQTGTILVDNIKVTDNTLVYPSVINRENLTDSVYSGIKSGSVSVPVTMSDGTTQSFTATYELTPAQTATPGTYDVEAEISGFSEKVNVAVTVKDSEAKPKSISSYIGDTVTFPVTLDEMSVSWKNYSGNTVTTADTTALGRKIYTGTLADGRTVTYTVNIGEFISRLSDNMSTHNNTKYTYTEISKTIDTVDPGLGKDGFKLTVNNTNKSRPGSATIVNPLSDDAYITIGTEQTPSNNMQWDVIDSFNGSFKVSMRIRIRDHIQDDNSNKMIGRVAVLSANQKSIALSHLYINKNNVIIRGEGRKADGTSYTLPSKNTSVEVTLSDGKYSTDWFLYEIQVLEDNTYDILVNGTKVHSGELFTNAKATNDIGSVYIDDNQTIATSVDYDDITVWQYNAFTGNLNDGINVTVPVGTNKVKLPLVLGNGSIKDFDVTVNCDTSKIAKISNAEASIAGFDGTVDANVKVCNYDITGVNLKSGSEFTTAPVAGGILESVNIKRLTDAAASMAIFTQYSQSGDIKAVKTVDISSLAKNDEKVLPVGMTLADDTAAGDYIRVYVWNSKTALQPLDMVTDLTFEYSAAPDIYIAAASTYESYSRTANPSQWPKTGVGQALSGFVSDEVSIVNLSKSGSSTHSFINDGLWKRILNNIKTGDYVIITFGHNDQVDCTDKTHPDGCVYGTNLRYFVESARAKGANPIICSPIVRRLEGVDGTPLFNNTTHKHIDKMVKVCTDLAVPFIDMTTLTMNYLQSLDNKETTDVNEAVKESEKLYMIDLLSNMKEYTSHTLMAKSRYNPTGNNDVAGYSKDNTHFNSYGAKVFAKILAEEIAKLNNNLSNFIVNTDETITYPALD